MLDGTACAPGIYRRSEALVQATRDFGRGRTTAAALEARRQADRELLVAVQRSSGLAPVTDGMLDWPDVFRPLVEKTEGLAPGSLLLEGARSATLAATFASTAPLGCHRGASDQRLP